MSDKSNDPAVLWQTFLGEMEKGFNSFANQTMGSEHFSRAMNQMTGTTMGAQKALGDVMEKYLTGMNLPSRAQMVSMGERLQAIEAQLNQITALLNQIHAGQAGADDRAPVAPKPPRTKRPPSTDGGKA